MRILTATAILMLAAAPAAAIAQGAPAAAAAAHYSTADTDLGTLLDDPAAKAVLVKYIPEVVSSDQIDMARSMTLVQLQSYASDKLTDKALSDIQVALNKLPVKN